MIFVRKEPDICPFCDATGNCGKEWCPYTTETK